MIGGTLPGRTEKIVSLSPLYLDHGGVIASAGFKKENMEAAMAYTPLDDDFHLITYPKSGTTWTEEIVRLIFNKGEPNGSTLESSSSVYIEHMGVEVVANMKRPLVIKTHLPTNRWTDPKTGKYIFVVRNPKDVVVSYFHHQRNTFGEEYEYTDGTFEHFFELFMNGPMEYDDYFDHLLSWYPYTKNENVILLHYEKLKDDPKGEILRLSEFMGEKWHTMLMEEEGILNNVLKRSSFDSMKKAYANVEFPVEPSPLAKTGSETSSETSKDSPVKATKSMENFVRTGKVGGWREMLTDEMNKAMNERINERLIPVCPEIVEMWREHGIMD